MAHIQHELLEHQKCDTLKFYVACYLVCTLFRQISLRILKELFTYIYTVVLTKLYRMN